MPFSRKSLRKSKKEGLRHAVDNDLRWLLERLRSGKASVDEVLRALSFLPFKDIRVARLDTHRRLRKGYAEVVLGEGKTPKQTAEIVAHLSGTAPRVLVTRASEKAYRAVRKLTPGARYNAVARVITVGEPPARTLKPPVWILSAGTSDLPVAEEAAVTAEFLGLEVHRLYDVGVAGLHRVFPELDHLQSAGVIVAVAGMEGALPSVIAGLVATPVIGVPTKTGYGVSFGGVAALMTMLNACSSGVAVVNIDNGFGAAMFAYSIIQRMCRK